MNDKICIKCKKYAEYKSQNFYIFLVEYCYFVLDMLHVVKDKKVVEEKLNFLKKKMQLMWQPVSDF